MRAKNSYEVIVSNIGTVYTGTNERTAQNVFREYWEQSDMQYGRASGENVTIMRNGEPMRTHYGTNGSNNHLNSLRVMFQC